MGVKRLERSRRGWATAVVTLAALGLASRSALASPDVAAIFHFIEIILHLERRPPPPYFSEEKPAVQIHACELEPQSGLNVGDRALVSFVTEVSYGAAGGSGKLLFRLRNLSDVPYAPPIYEKVFAQESTSFYEYIMPKIEVVALQPGHLILECHVEVFGKEKAFPVNIPRSVNAEMVSSAVQIEEPYALFIQGPEPATVNHGESATARLVAEILTQAEGRVIVENTTLNGHRAEVRTIAGNPNSGTVRRVVLATVSQSESCRYGEPGSLKQLRFANEAFDIRLAIPLDREGRLIENYEYRRSSEADPPTPVFATSFPILCPYGAKVDEKICTCVASGAATALAETTPTAEVPPNLPERGAEVTEDVVPATIDTEIARPLEPPNAGEGEAAEKPAADVRVVERLVLHPSLFTVVGSRMTLSGGPFDCSAPDLAIWWGPWQLPIEQCARNDIVAGVPDRVPPGLVEPVRAAFRDSEASSREPATALGVDLIWKGSGQSDELVPVSLRITGSDQPMRLQVSSQDHSSCRLPGGGPVDVVTRGGVLNEATVVCRRAAPGPIEVSVRLLP